MLNQCLSILKREDVKQILLSLLDILLEKWKPYLWALYCLLLFQVILTSLLLFQLYKKNFLR